MRVNTFLGCFELETGGLVLGWLNLVGNIIIFVGAIALLVVGSSVFYTNDEICELLRAENPGVRVTDENCKDAVESKKFVDYGRFIII